MQASATKAYAQDQPDPCWTKALVVAVGCHALCSIALFVFNHKKTEDGDAQILPILIALGAIVCVCTGTIQDGLRDMRETITASTRTFTQALSAISVALTAVILSGFVSVNW